MRARRQGSGFSLLELLIALAIGAILAALLFPVFSLVRAKARSGACQSNLRQIGQAMLMYAQDWDDYLPPRHQWQESLLSYVGNPRLFECPSSKRRFICRGAPGWDPETTGAYNMNLPVLPPSDWGAHESEIADPAGTVLGHDGIGRSTALYNAPSSPSDLVYHGVAPRHEGGTNVLWADGHVRWSSLEGLMNYSLWTGADD